MSPLPWTVQVPPCTTWLPAGTNAPPTSVQDHPVGHTPGGGLDSVESVTALNTTGVVVPATPAVATGPARYDPDPKGNATVEPSTGFQVTPSVEVRGEDSVWAGLTEVSCQLAISR